MRVDSTSLPQQALTNQIKAETGPEIDSVQTAVFAAAEEVEAEAAPHQPVRSVSLEDDVDLANEEATPLQQLAQKVKGHNERRSREGEEDSSESEDDQHLFLTNFLEKPGFPIEWILENLHNDPDALSKPHTYLSAHQAMPLLS